MPLTIPPDLQDLSEEESTEPGLWERAGGGFLVGAHRDPILGRLMDTVTERFIGADPQVFTELEDRLAGDRFVDVFEMVGQYGPSLAMGGMAYALGRSALITTLGQVAPRLAAVGAGRTAAQFGAVVAKLGETAETLVPLAKPALLRGTEMLGGALGSAAFGAAESTAAGDELPDVLKVAALSGVLSLGVEGALTGLGKLISPAAREIATDVPLDRWSTIVGGKPLRRSISSFRGQVTRAQNTLNNLNSTLGTITQADELTKATNRVARLTKAVGLRRGKLEAIGEFLDENDIIPVSIFRETPVDIAREGHREWIEKVLTNVVQTPVGLASKLGLTGHRLLTQGQKADANAFLGAHISTDNGRKIVERLARARNYSLPFGWFNSPKKLAKVGDDILSDVWDLAESRGMGAVTAKFGAGVSTVITDLSRLLDDLYRPLAERGASPLLTTKELGGGLFLPHVLQDRSIDEMERHLIQGMLRQGIPEATATTRAAAILEGGPTGGAVKFGSVDHMRILPGSLSQKIAANLPFEAPIVGLFRYLDAVPRRYAYAQVFGLNNELRDVIIKVGRQEGANVNLLGNLFDHLAGVNYYSRAARRAAQSISSLESATKLTFAPINNLTQGSNNAIFMGVRNAAKGVWASLRGRGPSTSMKAAAIFENDFDALNRVMSGVHTENMIDKMARWALKPMNLSERFNRTSAFGGSIYMMEDTFAKAVAGRLRGNSLEWARRRLGALHIDLGKVTTEITRLRSVGAGGGIVATAVDSVHGAGAYERALVLSTRLTQFLPARATTPFLWATPFGRLLFQFKTYSLNQGIFLRDQVVAEAARGNMRPLAVFAGIYPIAGEVAGNALSFLKDRDRPNGLGRLVDNLSMVGGFGMVQSMVMAAHYGRMQDWFLGPAITDTMSLAEALLQGNFDRLGQQLSRQPISVATKQLARGGATTVDYLREWADMAGDEPMDETPTPIHQLR